MQGVIYHFNFINKPNPMDPFTIFISISLTNDDAISLRLHQRQGARPPSLREAVPLLRPSRLQDLLLVLVRHHPGLPQHVHGGSGALRPAAVAHGLLVWADIGIIGSCVWSVRLKCFRFRYILIFPGRLLLCNCFLVNAELKTLWKQLDIDYSW